jgi:hypothetical protein
MMDLFDNIPISLQLLESPISHLYPQNTFYKIKTSSIYSYPPLSLSLLSLPLQVKVN